MTQETERVSVSKELLEKVVESLGSFISDHGWSASDMENYDALSAALEAKQTIPWIRVIDEAMVCAHIGVADAADDYATAKDKLNKLICWEIDVAKHFGQYGKQAMEVPPFNPAAKRKLEQLLADGAQITGYAFQKSDGRHGSIDCHGFVQWRTEQVVVQMPEPVAYLCPRRSAAVMPDSFLRDASFDALYTEHQVRTLLAKHGIKIAD